MSVFVGFINAFLLMNYGPQKKSQEYSSHILGKVATWSRQMEIQKKTDVTKPSDRSPYFLF